MRGSDPNLRYFVAELHRNNINYQIYQISPKELSRIAPTVQNKINETKRIASELNCLIGIVGGFVRDLLLGNPSHDVDFIVFSGDLQQLTEKVAEVLQGKIAKMFNKTFTTQIRFENGVILEFNATRKEYYEYPSRMPIVEKGSIVDDLYRRDFTINAMMADIDELMRGVCITDAVINRENLEDLYNGIIRTNNSPSITLSEDPIRVLRALRFKSKYNFKLEISLARAIEDFDFERFKIVGVERIYDELRKCIKDNTDLFEYDILKNLFNISYDYEKDQDIIIHILKTMKLTKIYGLKVSALFHDLGKFYTREWSDKKQRFTFIGHEIKSVSIFDDVSKKYKFPKKLRKSVRNIIKDHMKIKFIMDRKLHKRIRWVLERKDYIVDLVVFNYLDWSGKPREFQELNNVWDQQEAIFKFVNAVFNAYPTREERLRIAKQKGNHFENVVRATKKNFLEEKLC